MHVFDILAEAKIRQWEVDVREGREKKPVEQQSASLDMSESLEKALFRDIRKTLITAYMTGGEARHGLLAHSHDMQVQLAARLEKSGYNLMSTMLGEDIRVTHDRARAAEGNMALLTAMLDELE